VAAAQCDYSHLGAAVEAHWNVNRADADVGVEDEVPDAVQAGGVFVRQRGKEERPDERDPDLATVGVAGKLKPYGIMGRFVGEIGLVRQKDDGVGRGNPAKSAIEIGLAAKNIIDAGQEEAGAVVLDGNGSIPQDFNPMGL